MSTMTTILLLLPFLIRSSYARVMSIVDEFGDGLPICVRSCLYDKVGDELDCKPPFQNECYCATATDSVSAVTEYFDGCASDYCTALASSNGAGLMSYIYFSYCSKNGFTTSQQATMTASNPEETQATGSEPTTAAANPTSIGGSGTDNSEDSSRKLALGIGLGLGIPVAASLFGLGFCLGARRSKHSKPDEHAQLGGTYTAPDAPDSGVMSPYDGGFKNTSVSNPASSPLQANRISELSAWEAPSPRATAMGQHEISAEHLPRQGAENANGGPQLPGH